MKRILCAVSALMLFSFIATDAKADKPGDPCETRAIGTTEMSDDAVNILACLKVSPAADAAKVWKNYTPNNHDEDGETCIEGSVAVYKNGGFVCNEPDICNDGDLVVFRSGRYVCEGRDKTSMMKNYYLEYMGITKGAPSWDGSTYESNKATAWFRGKQNASNTIYLHEADYTAKSTGMARIVATIPLRYYQESDFWDWDWDSEDTYQEFEQTISGSIVVYNESGTIITRNTSHWPGTLTANGLSGDPNYGYMEDVSNPNPMTDGSSGDVATVITRFPIVKGKTYHIHINLPPKGNAGVNYRAWAGTIWLDDHYTAGSMEITEY